MVSPRLMGVVNPILKLTTYVYNGVTMLETLVGVLGTGMLGVITWCFRINSRVAVLEAGKSDLKELIGTKFDEVNRRLERIEERL